MNKNDANLAVDQVTERLEDQQEKLIYAERTAGVLRAANAHLRKKLDAALLQRDEARATAAQFSAANGSLVEALAEARAERDALKGIVASLHDRAVRATEALGVVYDVAPRSE